MTRFARLVLGLLLLSAMPAACKEEKTTDPLEARKLPDEVRADVSAVVDGANAFAIDLFHALRADPGNLFFSPYSVSTALFMTYAGARSVTEEEMRRILHLSLDQSRLHPAAGALQQSLNRGSDLKGYEIEIANRLWGAEDAEFLDPFLQVTRERYGAELARLDFSGAPEDARLTINQWVEERTKQKIRDLLPAGSITELTRLVLTNAIAFKGLWESRFDPDATGEQPFRIDATQTVQVPMMHQKASFPHGAAEGVQILELPYKSGDLSMIILLPEEAEGLEALEARLTKEVLEGWLGTLHASSIDVALPRFSMTSQFALGEKLGGMGMPSAFDPERADFSGMNGKRDLFIHAVVHKAFVEVNEEGTEAAAATGVTIGVTSAGPMFVADHPFLFLIRDRITGSILFLGRLANPLG